jgi:hypothetical protein
VYVPTCPTFSAIVVLERDAGTAMPTVVGVRDTKGDLFQRPLLVLLDFLAGTCCPLPPPLLIKPLQEKMPESGEKLSESGEKLPESSTNTSADEQTVSIVVLSLLLDVSLLANVAVVAGRRICERGNRLGGGHRISRGMVRAANAARERASAMGDQMSVNVRRMRQQTAANVHSTEESFRGLFSRPRAAATAGDVAVANNAPRLTPVDGVAAAVVVDVHPPPPVLPSTGTPRDERRPVVTPRRQAPPTPIIFRTGMEMLATVPEYNDSEDD